MCIITLTVALPAAPSSVTVAEVTATTARLSWSYPRPEEPHYFVLQYKPRAASQSYSEISGVITHYYTVRGLSPFTEYEFFVIAVNNIGRGPVSRAVVATTGETGKQMKLCGTLPLEFKLIIHYQ